MVCTARIVGFLMVVAGLAVSGVADAVEEPLPVVGWEVVANKVYTSPEDRRICKSVAKQVNARTTPELMKFNDAEHSIAVKPLMENATLLAWRHQEEYRGDSEAGKKELASVQMPVQEFGTVSDTYLLLRYDNVAETLTNSATDETFHLAPTDANPRKDSVMTSEMLCVPPQEWGRPDRWMIQLCRASIRLPVAKKLERFNQQLSDYGWPSTAKKDEPPAYFPMDGLRGWIEPISSTYLPEGKQVLALTSERYWAEYTDNTTYRSQGFPARIALMTLEVGPEPELSEAVRLEPVSGCWLQETGLQN